MARHEFEGRSAAEAAIKACEQLGVTRSALRYEVLSETGEGLDRRVVIAVDAEISKAQFRPRIVAPPVPPGRLISLDPPSVVRLVSRSDDAPAGRPRAA